MISRLAYGNNSSFEVLMSSHEVVHVAVERELHSHSRAKIETYCSIVTAEGKR